jgi:hypothetical protein
LTSSLDALFGPEQTLLRALLEIKKPVPVWRRALSPVKQRRSRGAVAHEKQAVQELVIH